MRGGSTHGKMGWVRAYCDTSTRCYPHKESHFLEALLAIFSILYIFWPLIILFGIKELFSKQNSPLSRLILALERIFIGWIVWAFFLFFIYWRKQQPILFMPEEVNHVLFGLLGLISGGVTVGWLIHRLRNQHIRLADAQKLDDLLEMTPEAFERLVAVLFQAYGYQAHVSEGKTDHGVDVWVSGSEGEKWVVQCKRYRGSVGEPVVRDLFGTMLHEDAQRAYLITTGSFTAQAKDWAEGKPIVLYDGDALIQLIRRTQKRVGQTFG